MRKIAQVKKKLKQQAKYWQNIQWEAAPQLAPRIDDFKA